MTNKYGHFYDVLDLGNINQALSIFADVFQSAAEKMRVIPQNVFSYVRDILNGGMRNVPNLKNIDRVP